MVDLATQATTSENVNQTKEVKTEEQVASVSIQIPEKPSNSSNIKNKPEDEEQLLSSIISTSSLNPTSDNSESLPVSNFVSGSNAV